jgi:hypothetical protein
MRVNFEEKTYENYFNAELDNRTEIFYPLGQVQEGNLGFDASANSRNRRLWRLIGHPFWFFPHFDGVELREIADEMERHIGRVISDIPKMKANLIFQYKKPEYIKNSLGKEWKHWKQPYFRFDIYKEQQELLMHIHNSFSKTVLVLYSSPAITDINDLVDNHKKRQILDVSNIKKASELNLHHRNTYIKAGTFSIACSEPEKLENFDIFAEFEKFNVENNDNINVYDFNRQFLLKFRNQIEQAIEENQYYSESFKLLNETLEKYKKYELLYTFLILYNFRQLTGTQWLIKI